MSWVRRTTRWSIYLRDDLACVYCKVTLQQLVRSPTADNFLTIDHIKPRSRLCDNDADNLVTACYDCNKLKNNRSLLEHCRNVGLAYEAVRGRITRYRRRGNEAYREAARVMCGDRKGVPASSIVYDHDFLVKLKWKGEEERQMWEEHFSNEVSDNCPHCGKKQDPVPF